MKRRWQILLLIASGIVVAVIVTVKSNPLAYCGYCQHEKMEKWKAGNAYQCTFWRFVFTSNSSDYSLYLNTPGG